MWAGAALRAGEREVFGAEVPAPNLSLQLLCVLGVLVSVGSWQRGAWCPSLRSGCQKLPVS